MTDAQILLLPEAHEDIEDLDGVARKVVFKGLLKLRTDPHLRGAPLGSRATGDLTGLRKLVVGNRDYRIVYRVEPDGTVVVVWVVAKRADDEAYELAAGRIQMYADPDKQAILRQLLDTAFAGASQGESESVSVSGD